MKSDDDIRRELRGHLADFEPTDDQLMAARARLEAHIAQAAGSERYGGRRAVSAIRQLRLVASVARRTLLPAFKFGVPFIAGFVVVMLLVPGSGGDSDIARCQSVLGYAVPCGAWLSLAAGAATAGVVGVAIGINRRRKKQGKS